MRIFLVAASVCLMLAGIACSAPDKPAGPGSPRAAQPAPSGVEHARDLLAGIFSDMAAIAESFSGGPNDTHGPVSDPTTLKRDEARLAAAEDKARALVPEVDKLRREVTGGR